MFVFKKVLPVLKHDKAGQEILDKLDSFLEQESPQLVYWLERLFEDQQNAVTYAELREAVLNGFEQNIWKWQEDYAQFVNEHLTPAWILALRAGAAPLQKRFGEFILDDNSKYIREWMRLHTAEFITNIGEDTRAAIKAILARGQDEGWTAQQMAYAVRPCIGLTRRDALANARYRQHVLDTLLKQNPNIAQEVAERQAHEASLRYASTQHRQRAEMIANTELAHAYNRGNYEGVRQAMAQGLMGACEKIWLTAGSERVCPQCMSLNGRHIGFEDPFNIAGKELYRGAHQIPPAHPRCRCVVQYVEYTPAMRQSNSSSSNRKMEYSEDEFLQHANDFKPIVEKSVGRESKWSGKLVFDYAVDSYSGKEWNCDIRLANDATDHVLLHEMIHSCSASYFGRNEFLSNLTAEELPVHLMSQEIAKRIGIVIEESGYDDGVQLLRDFKFAINYDGDLEKFARDILQQAISARFDWLENALNSRIATMSVEQYNRADALLDAIVGWKPT